jgi:hypothetical protein
MPHCSERMRVASCSADISSEKMPTTAPSWEGSSALSSGRWLSERARALAMLKAMLVASEDLPIAGRPAMMMRSEGCRPPILASRSLSPEAMPERPPSRW